MTETTSPQPERPNQTSEKRATSWLIFARLLTVAVFTQAVLAGLFLSAQGWARTVHGLLGPAVIVASLAGAIIATTTRRRWSSGGRLAAFLGVLTLVLLVQNVAGELSSGGSLLWLHVPLGVAAVGLAAQPSIVAAQMTARAETHSGKT